MCELRRGRLDGGFMQEYTHLIYIMYTLQNHNITELTV